jgi:murein DD-endopeptidase MepM/ murein hydrolase activator NlpD
LYRAVELDRKSANIHQCGRRCYCNGPRHPKVTGIVLSKRYTILVADRSTGATRRLTVSVRALVVTTALLLGGGAAGVLMVLGAGWRTSIDVAQLLAANHALRIENSSYRAMTGELTSQITSLQTVVTDLGERGTPDPEQRKAMENLPSRVRSRALGGATSAVATRSLISALSAPEDTFGVLRDLLGTLESRLRLVRSDVERWQALAQATPSMWPVAGWLSDGFGSRRDPFTGQPEQHLGLDISAQKGQPIYATASGTVRTAGYHAEFGNLVVVAHEFGLTTRYAHLSRFSVKMGDVVQRGDVVGYVGSTGRSTGPHLHFEVWANGRPINPLKLLTSQRR